MKMRVKSIYPADRPSFNEWCKMFNVSRLYADRTGINNAQKIMELWDGFTNMKQYFIKPIKINE